MPSKKVFTTLKLTKTTFSEGRWSPRVQSLYDVYFFAGLFEFMAKRHGTVRSPTPLAGLNELKPSFWLSLWDHFIA